MTCYVESLRSWLVWWLVWNPSWFHGLPGLWEFDYVKATTLAGVFHSWSLVNWAVLLKSVSKARYVFIRGHPSCTSLHKKFLEIENESSLKRGKEVSIADFQTFQSHDSAIQPKLVVLQNYLRVEEILPLEIHFGMSLNFLLHKRPLSAYSLNLPKKGSLRKHLKSDPFDGHLERLKDGILSDAIEGERSI